jgi:hypothetical protein
MHDDFRELERRVRILEGLLLRSNSNKELLDKIDQVARQIMSDISDASDAVHEAFDRVHTGLTGIAGDITDLKAQIAALPLTTPEDKAKLDAVVLRAQEIATRVTDLDAETPSTGPATPVEP